MFSCLSCFKTASNPFKTISFPPSLFYNQPDLLVLGAGWTSTFLLPLLDDDSSPPVSYVATTRDGRNSTLKWEFDAAEGAGEEQYKLLPRAKTVLITFPLRGEGVSKRMVEGYERLHGKVRWIQLGSTGLWDGEATLESGDEKRAVWMDRHSPFDYTNPRGIAEDELLSLSPDTFVLELSGLWGGARDIKNWIPYVASSKEALAARTSVHLIHGLDVARAILAVHLSPPSLSSLLSNTTSHQTLVDQTSSLSSKSSSGGQRYLITDLRVYDWWDLILAIVPPSSPTSIWVQELMQETGVRGLPRSPVQLGKALDSTEFWETFRLRPEKGRWETDKL